MRARARARARRRRRARGARAAGTALREAASRARRYAAPLPEVAAEHADAVAELRNLFPEALAGEVRAGAPSPRRRALAGGGDDAEALSLARARALAGAALSKARGFDVKKAAKMLEEHAQWRRRRGCRAARTSTRRRASELRKGICFVRASTARGGRAPVSRLHDGAPAARDLREVAGSVLFRFNQALECIPETGKLTVLYDRVDADKASGSTDLDALKLIAPILQNNFPERLHMLVVYPTSWVTRSLWSVIRSFLDPVTAAKFQFVSSPDEFGQWIDARYLLRELGGEDDFDYEARLRADPVGDAFIDGPAQPEETKEVTKASFTI